MGGSRLIGQTTYETQPKRFKTVQTIQNIIHIHITALNISFQKGYLFESPSLDSFWATFYPTTTQLVDTISGSTLSFCSCSPWSFFVLNGELDTLRQIDSVDVKRYVVVLINGSIAEPSKLEGTHDSPHLGCLFPCLKDLDKTHRLVIPTIGVVDQNSALKENDDLSRGWKICEPCSGMNMRTVL